MIRCRAIWPCLFAMAIFTSTDVLASAAEQKVFDSAGVPISYLDQGEGEAVVLVHGFTANATLNWVLPGIVQYLQDDYRVIAIDVRGHGRSGKPHDPQMYGMELVHDIIRLMDHLEIQRAHVVGYSMGAMISCKLLTTAPQRLISVTLGGAGWPRADDPRQIVLDELVESLENGRGIGPLLRALSPTGIAAPTDDQLRATSQLAMLVNDPKALAAMMRKRDGLIVPESDLRKNNVPVLALIGDQDPLKTMIDCMDGVCPKLEVVVIDDADHTNAFVKNQFKANLSRFLDQHRIQAKAVDLEPIGSAK